MGPFKITITETGATPRIMRRVLNNVIKAANATIGYHWHRYYRPKHFLPSGAMEYGYTPRKGQGLSASSKEFWKSYCGQKLRKMHHQKPLVWSGESESRTQQQDIRATSKGVRIVLHAPALNCQNPNSQVRMWEEMTTVSPAEAQILGVIFRDTIVRGLAAITERHVTVIAA